VAMVFELRAASGSSRGTLASVGHKLGINPETLRNWVEKAEIDGGQRPGTTSDDRKRIADLEREVRELRRANEILKGPARSWRLRRLLITRRRDERRIRPRATRGAMN
jgi:transposase